MGKDARNVVEIANIRLIYIMLKIRMILLTENILALEELKNGRLIFAEDEE